MSTPAAKHSHQQVGCAVGDHVVLIELWRAGHEYLDLEDPNVIKTPASSIQLGEYIEGALSGTCHSGLDIDASTHDPAPRAVTSTRRPAAWTTTTDCWRRCCAAAE